MPRKSYQAADAKRRREAAEKGKVRLKHHLHIPFFGRRTTQKSHKRVAAALEKEHSARTGNDSAWHKERVKRVGEQVLYGFDVLAERYGIEVPEDARELLQTRLDDEALPVLEEVGNTMLGQSAGGVVEGTYQKDPGTGKVLITLIGMNKMDTKFSKQGDTKYAEDRTDLFTMHELIHSILEETPMFKQGLVPRELKEQITEWYTTAIGQVAGYEPEAVEAHSNASAYRPKELDPAFNAIKEGSSKFRKYKKKIQSHLKKAYPKIKGEQAKAFNTAMDHLETIVDASQIIKKRSDILKQFFGKRYWNKIIEKYDKENSVFNRHDAILMVDHVLAGELGFEPGDFNELHNKFIAVAGMTGHAFKFAQDDVKERAIEEIVHSHHFFKGLTQTQLKNAVSQMGRHEDASLFKRILERSKWKIGRVPKNERMKKVLEAWNSPENVLQRIEQEKPVEIEELRRVIRSREDNDEYIAHTEKELGVDLGVIEEGFTDRFKRISTAKKARPRP